MEKEVNILWSNPWLCVLYLFADKKTHKSLVSAAEILTRGVKEDCLFLSLGSFYLVKYALSFKMMTNL